MRFDGKSSIDQELDPSYRIPMQKKRSKALPFSHDESMGLEYLPTDLP